MPKDSSAIVVRDLLERRQLFLAVLIDRVISKLKRSEERIRDLRIGIALTRDASTQREPATVEQRRDLTDLRE